VSRESLRRMKDDPMVLDMLFAEPEEPEERVNPDEYGRELE